MQRGIGCHHHGMHHIRIQFDDGCKQIEIAFQDRAAANLDFDAVYRPHAQIARGWYLPERVLPWSRSFCGLR